MDRRNVLSGMAASIAASALPFSPTLAGAAPALTYQQVKACLLDAGKLMRETVSLETMSLA